MVANLQNGDGSTINFTIPSTANASTNGTIIAINGVVQEPINAYSITNNIITFTEAPSETDIIDIRVVTPVSSVGYLQDSTNTTGVYLDYVASDKTVTIKNNNVATVQFDANGYIKLKANGTITSTPSITVGTGGGTMDTWSGITYKAAKYIIIARNSSSTGWTSLETLVVTDGGSNANILTYGVVNAGTSTPQVTISVSATGGVVTVTATGAGSGTVVNFNKNYIVGS